MAIITNDWTGTEYFKVNDFNHIECYTGNAKQSMHYYCFVMGFSQGGIMAFELGRSIKSQLGGVGIISSRIIKSVLESI